MFEREGNYPRTDTKNHWDECLKQTPGHPTTLIARLASTLARIIKNVLTIGEVTVGEAFVGEAAMIEVSIDETVIASASFYRLNDDV